MPAAMTPTSPAASGEPRGRPSSSVVGLGFKVMSPTHRPGDAPRPFTHRPGSTPGGATAAEHSPTNDQFHYGHIRS